MAFTFGVRALCTRQHRARGAKQCYSSLRAVRAVSPPRRRPCRVQAWRRQAFFALSNSTQVLLEPQRSALPGTPITAPAGASSGRF
jgi:hypothetical protein